MAEVGTELAAGYAGGDVARAALGDVLKDVAAALWVAGHRQQFAAIEFGAQRRGAGDVRAGEVDEEIAHGGKGAADAAGDDGLAQRRGDSVVLERAGQRQRAACGG